jgi:hypothetical protein
MKTSVNRYFVAIPLLFISASLSAQCGMGYTQAELNWDHIDFLPSDNSRYTSFYPSAAFPYSQNFAMGPRKINFNMYPAANLALNGENGTNTAHAGSHATSGDDVQFTTNTSAATTIVMTFDADVSNIKFSIFDLDNDQRVTITAKNSANADQAVTIAKANAGSGINITGSGSVTASAQAPGSGYGSNDNQGTINITINGPATSVTIVYSSASGNTWLSDIGACVTGSFPANYQQVSRPFNGQPQYVLTVVNNRIYYTDPTNGTCYFLFIEPDHDRLNSMAYDPYRRVVYYTFSLTDRVGLDPGVDKVLKKYDVDSKTISVVIPDVNTFGIPTYESGVESGAATFYNGSLYLGVEGYTGTTGNNAYAASRKSTIWKIDFDASGNPIAPAVQVFGVTADDGQDAQNIHDWSDFGISNGVLYDFDGSANGGIDYYHFNLTSGVRTRYAPVGVIPRQVSIGWDEKLYNVDANISMYNGTNGVGTQFTINAPLGPTIPSNGSWGDAAGPYRPFLDFGDAPASYDPDQWSPACHDTLTPTVSSRRTKLQLGADEDVEWLKKGFTTIEDNYEDGLSFVPIYSPINSSYLISANVLNNTGAVARVCAWLDYNGNGVFDPSEGIRSANIPSSAVPQTIILTWAGLPNLLPAPSYTYLRLRIAPLALGMSENNPTGYYSIGEVEDYRVVVDNYPLELDLLSFEANNIENSSVKLNWSATEKNVFDAYTLQRTRDGRAWEDIASIATSGTVGTFNHTYIDEKPYAGKSWYRLQLQNKQQAIKYSEMKMVNLGEPVDRITLAPNPATTELNLSVFNKDASSVIDISIVGMSGNRLLHFSKKLMPGKNVIKIPLQPSWPAGQYIVQMVTDQTMTTRKLVIDR